MDGLMSKLRKLDAYPKVNEDFYSRTLSGGVITMPLLLRAPYVNYIAFVSRLIEKALQRHGGRLEHNEACCGSCYGAETSAEDCCNSCEEVLEAYGKKGWAMTNPEEGFLQRIEDEEGEGCNIYGFLEVNKVAGNLQFSPGKSFQQSGVHVHDLLAFQKDRFNVSHDLLLGLSLHMEYQSLIL
uniref:Endoplasmic reticulum vesicle transporter C-terminal domain-containing protein n=1 Tax=Salix viminalis TaxID=40686 RepID=A0A6N2MH89_SALVM